MGVLHHGMCTMVSPHNKSQVPIILEKDFRKEQLVSHMVWVLKHFKPEEPYWYQMYEPKRVWPNEVIVHDGEGKAEKRTMWSKTLIKSVNLVFDHVSEITEFLEELTNEIAKVQEC